MSCGIILPNLLLLERKIEREKVRYEKGLVDLICILLYLEAE